MKVVNGNLVLLTKKGNAKDVVGVAQILTIMSRDFDWLKERIQEYAEIKTSDELPHYIVRVQLTDEMDAIVNTLTQYAIINKAHDTNVDTIGVVLISDIVALQIRRCITDIIDEKVVA